MAKTKLKLFIYFKYFNKSFHSPPLPTFFYVYNATVVCKPCVFSFFFFFGLKLKNKKKTEKVNTAPRQHGSSRYTAEKESRNSVPHTDNILLQSTHKHCGWIVWMAVGKFAAVIRLQPITCNAKRVHGPKLFCQREVLFFGGCTNTALPLPLYIRTFAHIWDGLPLFFYFCLQPLVYARTRTMEKMVLLYSVILL